MRFDNAAAQRTWNRRTVEPSRIGPDIVYALVACLVSLLWIADLAFGGNMFQDEPGEKLARWTPFVPGMLFAGLLVAFLFRSHMAKAAPVKAVFSAVGIGLLASLVAASIPYGFYFAGPMIFVQNWMITVPMCWFSFWIMRTADSSLRSCYV
jgi:hypothetical protein